MKRHGLEERLREELDMTPTEFARATGLSSQTLQGWHRDKRLLLKLVIAGYRHEVLCRSRDSSV